MDKTLIVIDNHVFIKPEYLNHEFISGNKLRKLKYNLKEAKRLKKNVLLTFGGAFSNHIAAVAYAGKEYGFETIGVIRGEELVNSAKLNPTLAFARECGMTFKFISRHEYRTKTDVLFIEKLRNEFGDFYLIPEGGTNVLAVKGCEEILTVADKKFDYICCPVGTGGTISGLINSSYNTQKIIGFPALKGDFLQEEIIKFANNSNWELISEYHFGGYAKINEQLVHFINQFKSRHKVALDPIYTGKMMFGIYDLLDKGYFKKGSKILAIHTGGLQGIDGMNEKLRQQNMPIIV
ncbi:1-aminocyclopropane-1-carboxylate deaminase/D-cysteine desulfhydrase [uncultured Psychroserpens sp.]|uniref:1-aminocyclopropane-1-carboxylate deaminase/D-cysteine desulfhydrase n=1 Tax=uncultured Psychroserpens sp. TaxID=255436 RepID=UPI00262AEC10|nr:pyridoxal-phosphate dependent enzyme [uncultured Psychroserpens sp.]